MCFWSTSFYSLNGPAGGQVSASDSTSSPRPVDSGWSRSGQAVGRVAGCNHWHFKAFDFEGWGPWYAVWLWHRTPHFRLCSPVDKGRWKECIPMCAQGRNISYGPRWVVHLTTALLDPAQQRSDVILLPAATMGREQNCSCTSFCYVLGPGTHAAAIGEGRLVSGLLKAKDDSCPGLYLSPQPMLMLFQFYQPCVRPTTNGAWLHTVAEASLTQSLAVYSSPAWADVGIFWRPLCPSSLDHSGTGGAQEMKASDINWKIIKKTCCINGEKMKPLWWMHL